MSGYEARRDIYMYMLAENKNEEVLYIRFMSK